MLDWLNVHVNTWKSKQLPSAVSLDSWGSWKHTRKWIPIGPTRTKQEVQHHSMTMWCFQGDQYQRRTCIWLVSGWTSPPAATMTACLMNRLAQLANMPEIFIIVRITSWFYRSRNKYNGYIYTYKQLVSSHVLWVKYSTQGWAAIPNTGVQMPVVGIGTNTSSRYQQRY